MPKHCAASLRMSFPEASSSTNQNVPELWVRFQDPPRSGGREKGGRGGENRLMQAPCHQLPPPARHSCGHLPEVPSGGEVATLHS